MWRQRQKVIPAVNAIFAANENVRQYKTTVPSHLQDAHYKGSKNLGHGIGYKYAHDYPGHYMWSSSIFRMKSKTPGSMNPAILVMKNRSKNIYKSFASSRA